MSKEKRILKTANNALAVTSLPIPYAGGGICTWDYFKYNSEKKAAIKNWLVANQCNSIVCLIENLDPNNRFSIFRDKFGGKINRRRRDMVVDFAKEVHDSGGIFVPCIHSDANGKLVKQYEQQKIAMAVLGDMLESYWDAIIFALEGDEIFSRGEQEGVIQFLQSEVTDKPVGSHGRFDPATFPRNANFWANEFPWSPLDGDSHSVEETVAIGQWVIAESGVDTWFLEDCWNPIGEMCRRHARALVGLPGCVGVGAPLS